MNRIAFVEHQMKESKEQCERLGADLRESLNSVCALLSLIKTELYPRYLGWST
jgi:hypothetical protein